MVSRTDIEVEVGRIFEINDKVIGHCHPAYIIAEAGINHNGDIKIAKQLVDIAKKAGCDAIKFQVFRLYELENRFKNLSYNQYFELKKYCDFKGITFLATPHSYSAISFLKDVVPVVKIASPHIVDSTFVMAVKSIGKPVIASTGSLLHETGRATYSEIENFLNHIRGLEVALLYCVSKYPTREDDVSIEDFVRFHNHYKSRGYITGYSCHFPDIEFAIQTVRMGGRIVEKHITIDSDFDCPDKNVSIPPDKLEEMVEKIREVDVWQPSS